MRHCDRSPHGRSPLAGGLRPCRGAALLVATVLVCVGAGSAPAQSPEPTQLPDSFEAQAKRKFRKAQNRPIKLGTSGSNLLDQTATHCCGGTLGALVEKNGIRYVLSNNHVIARLNKGRRGEPIIQPGLIDQPRTCIVPEPESETVAQLSAKKRIRFGLSRQNKVDAAIAEVRPGAVDPDGRIIKLGVPGDTPVEPRVGMAVKKVGRTTGLRRGSVVAVNARATVDFLEECGSDVVRTARFVDQFIVMGNQNSFSGGGDSGSVVYRDVESCPSPVGLLFAGDGTYTLASPATTVLKVMGNREPTGEVAFVGCRSSAQGDFQAAGLSGRRPIVDEREVEAATRVIERRERQLFATPGVEAVGVGVTLSGPLAPAILVFVSRDREEMLGVLPAELDEHAVEVIPSGRFIAY